MKEHLLLNLSTDKITDDQSIGSWKAFLKSLNLKTDIYGWCNLDLLDAKATVHLEEIKQYCDKNKLLLKGFLDLEEDISDSEWYKVNMADIDMDLDSISSYKVPYFPFISDTESLCIVSEDIYNTSIEHNIKGIRFCWIPDKGKYASKQFFKAVVDLMIPYIFSCKRNVYEWNTEDYKLVDRYSENTKFAVKYVYDLSVNCPIYIPAFNTDDSFMYYNYSFAGFKELLIRKEFAFLLIEKKICKADDFTPVKVSDTCPEGYRVYQNCPISFVSEDFFKKNEIKYSQFKNVKRQEYIPDQETTLMLLKKAKSRYGSYYSKGLSKAETEKLSDSEYAFLLPYLQICNGGFLSGEYELYSYAKCIDEKTWYKDLSDELIPGIVIGGAADGDYIVLYKENIHRVSHEDFRILNTWDNIHHFVYQALSKH